ncbi:MAG: Dabb family protein [FCB group bacterium]|jgi:hypothetical protein
MIKHIVMFKLQDFAEDCSKQENILKFKKMLEVLPSKISFIKLYEIGINYWESERAYDIVLVSGFDTKEDLEAYRIHPDHVKVADFILKVREQSHVVDYEV